MGSGVASLADRTASVAASKLRNSLRKSAWRSAFTFGFVLGFAVTRRDTPSSRSDCAWSARAVKVDRIVS